MGRLALTSGTVSVRRTRLVAKGVVTRTPSPDDARGAVVALTDRGLALFDAVAPAHLHNEDVLLSALTAEERGQLVDLLGRLLVGFEHPRAASPLGVVVAPAHLAQRMRTAVGLSDTAGLLVTDVVPGSPAADAGLLEGDLLVAVDAHELRSCVDLATRTAHWRAGKSPLLVGLLRGESRLDVSIDPPQPPEGTASPPAGGGR